MRPGDLPIGVTLVDARAQRRKLYSPLLERMLPPFVPSMDLGTVRVIKGAALAFSRATAQPGPQPRHARSSRRQSILSAAALVMVWLAVGASIWWAVGLGSLWAVIELVWVFRRRTSFHPAWPYAVVAAMIQHGRCPACAYQLADSTDGVTRTCAECGACWNMDVSEWA